MFIVSLQEPSTIEVEPLGGRQMIIQPEIRWATGTGEGPGVKILIVHGMEFHSCEEVLAQLVSPLASMVTRLRRPKEVPSGLGYLYWDSRLDSETGRKMFPLGTFAYNAARMGKRLLHPEVLFASLESRATMAGEALATAITRLLADDPKTKLLVITHSMGGLVWAEAVRRLLDSGVASAGLGRWLNLQPAIPVHRFNVGARYGDFDRAFGDAHSIFFSRYDFVLRSLFNPLAGGIALGQIGPTVGMRGRHADVSKIAWEAHGQTSLFPKLGGFLCRSRHKIATYLDEVC